jgi:hypothetical protein
VRIIIAACTDDPDLKNHDKINIREHKPTTGELCDDHFTATRPSPQGGLLAARLIASCNTLLHERNDNTLHKTITTSTSFTSTSTAAENNTVHTNTAHTSTSTKHSTVHTSTSTTSAGTTSYWPHNTTHSGTVHIIDVHRNTQMNLTPTSELHTSTNTKHSIVHTSASNTNTGTTCTWQMNAIHTSIEHITVHTNINTPGATLHKPG